MTLHKRHIAYFNFTIHYSFVIFSVWLSGIGIDYFTNFPAPSFGIHTFIMVYIIVFIHRQFMGGNVDLTEEWNNWRGKSKPPTEPTISDSNPLD